MINGRMWCVVNPSVGIPVFLGGVVLMSLTVHRHVLDNAPWFSAFFAGG